VNTRFERRSGLVTGVLAVALWVAGLVGGQSDIASAINADAVSAATAGTLHRGGDGSRDRLGRGGSDVRRSVRERRRRRGGSGDPEAARATTR
jgi:hypothetical protein